MAGLKVVNPTDAVRFVWMASPPFGGYVIDTAGGALTKAVGRALMACNVRPELYVVIESIDDAASETPAWRVGLFDGDSTRIVTADAILGWSLRHGSGSGVPDADARVFALQMLCLMRALTGYVSLRGFISLLHADADAWILESACAYLNECIRVARMGRGPLFVHLNVANDNSVWDTDAYGEVLTDVQIPDRASRLTPFLAWCESEGWTEERMVENSFAIFNPFRDAAAGWDEYVDADIGFTCEWVWFLGAPDEAGMRAALDSRGLAYQVFDDARIAVVEEFTGWFMGEWMRKDPEERRRIRDVFAPMTVHCGSESVLRALSPSYVETKQTGACDLADAEAVALRGEWICFNLPGPAGIFVSDVLTAELTANGHSSGGASREWSTAFVTTAGLPAVR